MKITLIHPTLLQKILSYLYSITSLTLKTILKLVLHYEFKTIRSYLLVWSANSWDIIDVSNLEYPPLPLSHSSIPQHC